jgi:hypothetical protein
VNSKPTTPPWQEPLETWLIQSRNHRLPPVDQTALNALLRSSPEARAHAAGFLADDAILAEHLRQSCMEALFEGDAAALAAVQAPPPSTLLSAKHDSRFPWRTLTTLAAGLILGLFSASVVFGYVGSLFVKDTSLLNESFEGGASPEQKGAPLRAGVWSGDFSEVTGPFAGITPAQGGKMLRFLRADHLDKASRTGCKGDIYRILDVREYAASFVGGKSMVTAEASFGSIPNKAPATYEAAIELQAIETLPATLDQFFFPSQRSVGRPANDAAVDTDEAPLHFKPATSHRQVSLASTSKAWQRVRAELRIPPGTRYIIVGLHIVDPVAASQKPELRDVSFPGQFTDDIQVRLIHKVPLP